MTPLTDLLRRVEGATGPDRELDADVLAALLDARRERGYHNANAMRAKGSADLPARDYWRRCGPLVTASVDAALALVERVLPGLVIDMCRLGRPGNQFQVREVLIYCGEEPDVLEVERDYWPARPAPLAILEALLHALIARESADV